MSHHATIEHSAPIGLARARNRHIPSPLDASPQAENTRGYEIKVADNDFASLECREDEVRERERREDRKHGIAHQILKQLD